MRIALTLDRLYFRVQSILDGRFDQVAWDPGITYTGVTPSTDVNGLDNYRFQASRDFTLGGRPSTVTAPISGTLHLSGDVSKISESFDISAKEAGGVIDFTLKPKTKDNLFDSLRLSFRNGMVNDMQLIDSVGQRTNILFTGVKANEAISASKFKFDIPKGADVIQE